MKEIAEELILAPYPSTNEYKPIKNQSVKSILKHLNFFFIINFKT